MEIWIVFNEENEVMGVYDNDESANKIMSIMNESSMANLFYIEKHIVETEF